MKWIEVEKIPPKGLKVEKQMQIDQSRLTEGKLEGPVEVKVRVVKKGIRVHMSGTVKTKLTLTCSRCLEEYTRDMESKFQIELVPVETMGDRQEVELEEKDLEVVFFQNGLIDFEQMIIDQINLSIPMKPLCKEDCKGLCPVCGANLNQTQCGHSVKVVDPRLAKLKLLLEVKNGST